MLDMYFGTCEMNTAQSDAPNKMQTAKVALQFTSVRAVEQHIH